MKQKNYSCLLSLEENNIYCHSTEILQAVNNECFTHTADPVFVDKLLFSSVRLQRQLTHQLLMIKSRSFRTQSRNNSIYFFEKSWRQIFICIHSHINLLLCFVLFWVEPQAMHIVAAVYHFLHERSILLSIFCKEFVCCVL